MFNIGWSTPTYFPILEVANSLKIVVSGLLLIGWFALQTDTSSVMINHPQTTVLEQHRMMMMMGIVTYYDWLYILDWWWHSWLFTYEQVCRKLCTWLKLVAVLTKMRLSSMQVISIAVLWTFTSIFGASNSAEQGKDHLLSCTLCSFNIF